MKLELIDIFSKNTHVKFHENPSSGSRVVPSGRADRQIDRERERERERKR